MSEAIGRRTAATRRRLDATVLLAVLLPVLALLAAFGVHAGTGGDAAAGAGAPSSSPLDRATLGCPPGVGGASTSVATIESGDGDVQAGSGAGDDTRSVGLTPDTPTDLPGSLSARDPLVVVGTGPSAPGLVAGRFARPLAAADCRPPVADQWFTGVGAGAKHDSVLVLTDPDPGQAVVEVDVLGRDGVVAADSLREIVVRGGETTRIDLGTVLPKRYDLTLHVRTLRGRVLAGVADSFAQIGEGAGTADWLPAQDAASTANLLLGLPAGKGRRVLELANPGDDEGRATIALVTPQSVFTPAEAKDVTVPAGSSVQVSLSSILGSDGTGTGKGDRSQGQQPLGLLVTSTVPTTASTMMLVGGDLLRTVPPPALAQPGAVLLPELPAKASAALLLAGASTSGKVVVHLWDARGRPLDDLGAGVDPGQGYRFDLPAQARLAVVDPQGTGIAASTLLTDPSTPSVAASLVRTPLTTGLVPVVSPGSP